MIISALSKNPLGRLLPSVRPHLAMVALSTLLRLLNLFLGMVLFGFSGYLLARTLLFGTSPGRVDWLLLIGAGFMKAGARYGEQIFGHVAAFRILDTLRQNIFTSLTKRPIHTLSGLRTGDLVSRAMGDVELVEIFFAHTLAPGITAVVFVFGTSVLSGFLVHPLVGAVLFLLYSTAGIILPLVFQKVTTPAGRENRQFMGRLSTRIHESLSGIQDIAAFGAVEHQIREMTRFASRAYALNRNLSLLSGIRDILVDGFLLGSLLILLFGGYILYPQGNPAVLWGLVAAFAGGFGAILGLNRAVDDLPKSSAAASRILEVLQFPCNEVGTLTETSTETHTAGEATSRPGLAFENRGFPDKTLDFQGVSFTYGDNPSTKGSPTPFDDPGIRNVTFSLSPGEHVFLAGRSGAGKSTVVSLLLGFAQPHQGQVLLGGIPVTHIEPERRFSIISAARQNGVFVRGTVQENIELGLPAGQTAIPTHALEIPDLPLLFTQLPDGPATQTSGTDEQISGGQRRRIHLAAALARDPEILVLDEAFAGLDDRLKQKVRSRLIRWAQENRVTLVEVSHEMADARDADRVLVMDRGEIVQEGTYLDLEQQEGMFRQLADL